MSGPGLEPHRPDPAWQLAADDGFWDDAVSRDNQVWRYARRLAAAAAQEHERAAGGARKPAQAPGEAAAARAQQPAVSANARLRDGARGVGQALLLVAAAGAGVANGMAVGRGAPPLDLQSWRPLVVQAAPTEESDALAAPAPVAGATLVSSARTVTLPALPSRTAVVPVPEPAERMVLAAAGGVPAGAILRPEPAERLVLAVATGGMPAGAIVRPEPPAAPWRVQLALLRNPRHAEPVWRSFVTRLGAHTRGLERHVLPTRTARGLRHLVQAGPFADAGAAEALCRRLLAAGGDCLVVPPPS